DARSPDPLGIGLVPKLADFGLAKVLSGGGARPGDTLTRDGAIQGTFEYMAPEQAVGDSRKIDRRTDVHALGVLLYELLTGRVPFRGETLIETLRKVEREEPIAPRRLRPDLPRDLEVICLKCLEKSREKRYATAALLAEDLGRFLSGRPILARPAG